MKFAAFIIGLVFQLLAYHSVAQQDSQLGYMPWHKQDRLKLDFLVIDKATDSLKTCELHFLIKVSGEAFTKHTKLGKGFLNHCVKNYMFNDSWIDTTYGTASQIEFLQVKFDLAELYARKLRKALYENGHATNKFVKTTQKTLLTECSNEFGRLERETSYGRNYAELAKWKSYISSNLESLSEYQSNERATPTNGI